jgi:hypothetical protein
VGLQFFWCEDLKGIALTIADSDQSLPSDQIQILSLQSPQLQNTLTVPRNVLTCQGFQLCN